MPKRLKYFCYVSRSKVNQLYDQLTDFSETETSRRDERGSQVDSDVEGGAVLGFFKAALRVGARSSTMVESKGTQSTIQRLEKVLDHIQRHESVLNLNDLCRLKKGVKLDGLCYSYSGRFHVQGTVQRRQDGGVYINESAFAHGKGVVVVSRDKLISPARAENRYREKGPNKGWIVSDMCLLASTVASYELSLACSYKYFGDMGGNWYEHDKEWNVSPHSGNHHFFDGKTTAWFDTLLFINGIEGSTIMGTPLFLVHAQDPKLVI